MNSTSKPARGARGLSVQIAAKTAKLRHIRLRVCTREFNTGIAIAQRSTKLQLATPVATLNGRCFTRIRYLSRFAQALARFGAGEIPQGGEFAVTIVKPRKEFLIGTQIVFGVPLQMASK
jgi:hypothetical protein